MARTVATGHATQVMVEYRFMSEKGGWKKFDYAAFERACRDAEYAHKQELIESAFAESADTLSNFDKMNRSRNSYGDHVLTMNYDDSVLQAARARLVDGNPALAPHLCINDSILTYQHAPGCHKRDTSFYEKIFGR